MAALPYMQLYVADYLADTMHLTTEEHGAYLLLIFNYWQTGKPIPKGRLSRIARVPVDRWKDIESALSEFFEDDGEQWIHLRIERDIETVTTKPRGKSLPGGDSLTGYKGYVYFVTDPSSDLVKVGYSKNPWARLSELRRSHGVALSVVATIKTVEKSETPVHVALTEFHADGEWFHKTDAIKGLIEAISGGVVTTVDELRSYVGDYGSATTSTTNKDTDTDIKEHTQRVREQSAPPPDDDSERPKFAMTDAWEPDPRTFTAVLTRNGLAGQTFRADQLLEFRSYWISRPSDLKTQAQWEHKLAQQLKHQHVKNQSGGLGHEASGRSARSRTRNAHDILTDTSW
ncbi:DUF1376 domain-containing protein [Pseudomonas sp. RC10]|uniref:DUF1376 domain-containing protein n=1 Tax=Pseudomonas bambusae TaxID=3139142 RepID=UPI00313A446B